MNFIFLTFMEVWTQWVPYKVNMRPEIYFACDLLRSYSMNIRNMKFIS